MLIQSNDLRAYANTLRAPDGSLPPSAVVGAVAALAPHSAISTVFVERNVEPRGTEWRVVALVGSRHVLHVSAWAAIEGWSEGNEVPAGGTQEASSSIFSIASIVKMDAIDVSATRNPLAPGWEFGMRYRLSLPGNQVIVFPSRAAAPDQIAHAVARAISEAVL